jgi:hypothetical protein
MPMQPLRTAEAQQARGSSRAAWSGGWFKRFGWRLLKQPENHHRRGCLEPEWRSRYRPSWIPEEGETDARQRKVNAKNPCRISRNWDFETNWSLGQAVMRDVELWKAATSGSAVCKGGDTQSYEPPTGLQQKPQMQHKSSAWNRVVAAAVSSTLLRLQASRARESDVTARYHEEVETYWKASRG